MPTKSKVATELQGRFITLTDVTANGNYPVYSQQLPQPPAAGRIGVDADDISIVIQNREMVAIEFATTDAPAGSNGFEVAAGDCIQMDLQEMFHGGGVAADFFLWVINHPAGGCDIAYFKLLRERVD